MSSFVGVVVSDPWLQNQFTQVELRHLKSQVSIVFYFFFPISTLISHYLLIGPFDLSLPPQFLSITSAHNAETPPKLRDLSAHISALNISEDDITSFPDLDQPLHFELFLRVSSY